MELQNQLISSLRAAKPYLDLHAAPDDAKELIRLALVAVDAASSLSIPGREKLDAVMSAMREVVRGMNLGDDTRKSLEEAVDRHIPVAIEAALLALKNRELIKATSIKWCGALCR
jgi:hypothetical protein